MISISKQNNPGGRLFFLALVCLTLAGSLHAQQYDSLLARYKKEDAVVIKFTEHMVIANEGGELTATSYFNKEKLFISDLSRGTCNNDYLFHSDFHELTDISAWAMIPGKKGYQKVPCNNYYEVNPDGDNVFYDDNRALIVSFTGLLKKSVTHTYYAIEHKDLHMLPPFTWQQNIPVDKAVFELTAPKYVQMAFVLKGPDTASIHQSKEEKAGMVTYRFTIRQVPAFKEFDHVPSHLYYVNQVIPYIVSYKLSESNKKVDMLANTDQLYKHLYKYVKNLNMKEDTLLNNTVAEIIKKDHDDREKAKHIYQWVQQNLHYIAFEKGLEGFVPRDAAQVLRRKYGDCKDMTAILVTMCRKAGLEACYTWIGTREKPYRLEETPLPLVSNHMICALKLNGDWMFMDGTHPYIPFGQVPDAIQGKEAMIAIDEKNYKVVTIPFAPAENNVLTDSTTVRFEDRKITGTLKQSYSGYEAWRLGAMKMYIKGDDWDKYIRSLTTRGSEKFKPVKPRVSLGKTPQKDASIETEFAVDDYVSKAGKKYYVNMNLRRTFADNYIDTEARTIPYYFDYKCKTREVVVLEVPRGFKVTHVPGFAEGSVDGLWNYKIHYYTEKGKVTLVKEYELNTLEARSVLFAGNNKMVDDLKKIYQETVVLTAK